MTAVFSEMTAVISRDHSDVRFDDRGVLQTSLLCSPHITAVFSGDHTGAEFDDLGVLSTSLRCSPR